MSFHPQKCSHQDSYKPTTCHTNTIHSTWSHSRTGSDYVCLDINKLMYDLEHDDETVVISSLLKWLPAEVLYHMRHAGARSV
jgi:hypothetical protein